MEIPDHAPDTQEFEEYWKKRDVCIIFAISAFVNGLGTPVYMKLTENSLEQYAVCVIVFSVVFCVSIWRLTYYQHRIGKQLAKEQESLEETPNEI